MPTERLKNVLQIAADNDIKKASKKEALALLETLIAGGEICDASYASLYKYFLPAMPRTPKTQTDWVRKGVPTTDRRFYLNYLHVTEDGVLQSANGHVLLQSTHNDQNLEPGLHCAKSLLKADMAASRYPDFKRVMPKPDGDYKNLLGAKKELVKVGTEYVYILGDDKIALNKNYYDLVMSNPSPCWAIWVKDGMRVKDGLSGAIFEFENCDKAVIMPMRVS